MKCSTTPLVLSRPDGRPLVLNKAAACSGSCGLQIPHQMHQNRKKNKPPAPPPSISGVTCFGQMVRGARRSCAELAHLEAGRPERLDTRRTTSVHAGNVASRMQTKARACHQNICRSSSQAASTCTEKRARACRGASNACCVAVRQPDSWRRASVVQGGACVG